MTKDLITYEEVNALLNYDPETGILTWKVDRGSNNKAGGVAGGISEHGYIRISLNSIRYTAHKLIWLLYYGEHPSSKIDHINRDGLDNRICNLRLVSVSDNNFNRSIQKNNTTGYKGVCQKKSTGKYWAQIYKNGKMTYLGSFHDMNDAILAYEKAAREIYSELENPTSKSKPRIKKVVTYEELSSIFTYNNKTGNLIWVNSRGPQARKGTAAGTVDVAGYLSIQLFNKGYKAHRLVWMINYGEFPDGIVDHIDGNRLNNKIENLRIVTASENSKNTRVSRANTSGVKGVNLNKRSGGWVAQIGKEGKHMHLGTFSTKEKATEAYENACRELFPVVYNE